MIDLLELDYHSLKEKFQLASQKKLGCRFSEANSIYNSVLEKKDLLLTNDLVSFVTEALYQQAKLHLNDLMDIDTAHIKAKELLKVAEQHYYLIAIIQANTLKVEYAVYQNNIEKAKELIDETLCTAKSVCGNKTNKKDYKIAQRVLAEVYMTSGWIKYLNGNLDDASKDYTEALILAEQIENQKLFYSSFKGIGRCYQNQGFHDKALASFEKAYNLANDNNDIKEIIQILTYLAVEKRYLGEYKEALETSIKSYNKAKEVKLDAIEILHNLALLYYDVGNYKLAEAYFDTALEQLETISWTGYKAILTGNRARVDVALGRFSQAKKGFNSSIEAYEKSGIEIGLAENLCNYIELLSNTGFAKDPKTKQLLKIAKSLATKHRSVCEELNYKYAEAIMHKGSENFGFAKQILQELVIDSKDYRFFEVYVNVNLTLAELHLERFKRLQLSNDYENAVECLEKAEESARDANLLPKVIQILMVNAQLLSANMKFNEAFKILNEAKVLCDDNKLLSLSKKVDDVQIIIQDKQMLIQESSSVSTEAFKDLSVDEVLFQFSSKQYNELLNEFSSDTFYSCVFKQDITGPELFVSEKLPFKRSEDVIPIGVLYSSVLGQGNRHNEGLFGPLPVANLENFISLIYAKSMYDSGQLDERMKKHSYSLFCLFYHKKYAKLFYNRDLLSEAFEKKLNELDNIQNISIDFLSALKDEIEKKIKGPN